MGDNRGRWGAADERGALNLLGPATVSAAVATVASGEVVDLAQPLGEATPAPGGRGGVVHHMDRDAGDYALGGRVLGRSRFAEDSLTMSLHVGTHVDSLCHVWYDEELYNGHPQSAVRSNGAKRCGVEKLGPIVARGVLLDLAAEAGLGRGEAVGRAALERCAARVGGDLRSGDAVLLRTGWYAASGDDYLTGEPGLDLEGAAWLAAQDVAVVGADNYAIEALAGETNSAGFPVHELLLRDHGIPLIENLDLEGLADRATGTFLFVAAPLPLQGATASPLAPIAVL
jgi:kynurenine formamidase